MSRDEQALLEKKKKLSLFSAINVIRGIYCSIRSVIVSHCNTFQHLLAFISRSLFDFGDDSQLNFALILDIDHQHKKEGRA